MVTPFDSVKRSVNPLAPWGFSVSPPRLSPSIYFLSYYLVLNFVAISYIQCLDWDNGLRGFEHL